MSNKGNLIVTLGYLQLAQQEPNDGLRLIPVGGQPVGSMSQAGDAAAVNSRQRAAGTRGDSSGPAHRDSLGSSANASVVSGLANHQRGARQAWGEPMSESQGEQLDSQGNPVSPDIDAVEASHDPTTEEEKEGEVVDANYPAEEQGEEQSAEGDYPEGYDGEQGDYGEPVVKKLRWSDEHGYALAEVRASSHWCCACASSLNSSSPVSPLHSADPLL